MAALKTTDNCGIHREGGWDINYATDPTRLYMKGYQRNGIVKRPPRRSFILYISDSVRMLILKRNELVRKKIDCPGTKMLYVVIH